MKAAQRINRSQKNREKRARKRARKRKWAPPEKRQKKVKAKRIWR